MENLPMGVRFRRTAIEDLPLGMRFLPSDEEKIAYLLYKMNGKPMPCHSIHLTTVDIYGDEEPWEIFKNSENLENHFFTQTKFHRRVGKGVWEALDGEVSVCDSKGEVIGFLKRFKYKSCERNTDQDEKWILQEYSLGGKFQRFVKPEYADYRFCSLVKIPDETDNIPSLDLEEFLRTT